MAYVAHRYRRQYELNEEETRWVNEWINRRPEPATPLYACGMKPSLPEAAAPPELQRQFAFEERP